MLYKMEHTVTFTYVTNCNLLKVVVMEIITFSSDHNGICNQFLKNPLASNCKGK